MYHICTFINSMMFVVPKSFSKMIPVSLFVLFLFRGKGDDHAKIRQDFFPGLPTCRNETRGFVSEHQIPRWPFGHCWTIGWPQVGAFLGEEVFGGFICGLEQELNLSTNSASMARTVCFLHFLESLSGRVFCWQRGLLGGTLLHLLGYTIHNQATRRRGPANPLCHLVRQTNGEK